MHFWHVTFMVHVRDFPVAFVMMLKGIIYSTGEIFVNEKMTQMISAAGLFTSSFGYVFCTQITILVTWYLVYSNWMTFCRLL